MTTRFSGHLLVGDHASRPAFGAVPEGTLYSCTDHGLVYQSDGVAAWSTWATLGGGAPAAHATSHQNGGSDEISVAGLSGLLADDQNPTTHATDHQNGGGDEISVAGLSGLLADGQTPLAHKTSHENGGSDEIGVAGLSGTLADAQPVAVHKNGTLVGTRKNVNLIEGTNVTLTIADDAGDDEVDVTIAAAGGSGKLVQVVNTLTGAMATGTTVIPHDDTIPQNTEGTEFMTRVITPTSATNILKIDVVFNGTSGTGIRNLVAALFQDTAADALACGNMVVPTANYTTMISFSYFMLAGTTSATTFKVRAGVDTSGTVTFNGTVGARKYGGVLASSITISEIIP